jgi:hypothetical protein
MCRGQVQLAASYINHIRLSDAEAYQRFLLECASAPAVAALVKAVVSGGLKSDSLAEEVGVAALMHTLSGVAPAHAEQLFPRGGASKIIKKLAGNLKSGRAQGSSSSWNISLDMMHCLAAFPFALEPLNKMVYVAAVKGAAASKKAAARVVLELYAA